MDYQEFLDNKRVKIDSYGIGISESDINPMLFGFQRSIVKWALAKGKAALFEDCGLGKTFQQLEWSRIIHEKIGGDILILAPLAVAEQTAEEGKKLGIDVHICRTEDDCRAGINITNYEMLHHFTPNRFVGIVLDESSCLKQFSGKFRRQVTDFAKSIGFRLAATATPAPNDLIEITNHAEFLGVMSGKEIIALFFTQDGNSTHNWRLKGHAKEDFWKWMAQWCVALRKPSDLGFDDGNYVLPPIHYWQHIVEANNVPEGYLFALEAQTLQERQAARRNSTSERVSECAKLVNDSDEPWIVWCDLNRESEALRKAIPGSVEVRGSDKPDYKKQAFRDFATGKVRTLITKPSIAGHGLNWQHCRNTAFVGLSDSYENMYQAIRRIYRFGQLQEVNIHVIISEQEGAVLENIQRKENESMEIFDNIIEHMRGLELDRIIQDEMAYEEDQETGEGWELLLGDSIKRINEIETESCGLSIFSPPFPGMYAYTNSRNDIGNTTTIDQMIDHFRFLVTKDKLMRILKPGRLCAIHLMQLTAMKSRDGYIGIHDYRGRVIEMMEREGWIYHGEVCIDKNPQVQATRNKERGLLFKSLATDSSVMRMALADYLILFRKPGDNPEPIRAGVSQKYNNPDGWITEKEWIEWAAPVWYRQTKDYPGGIRETDVLNVAQARETDDERHLCPLQLGVIERALKLWSNPGDTIFSPFAGIGSEGYQALKFNRKFIGIELKRSYYENAIHNLKSAEEEVNQPNLFDWLDDEREAMT